MQQPPGPRPTQPSSVATTPIPSRSASCAARSPRATVFRRNNTDSEPQRFLRGTIATGDRFVSGAEAKAAAIAATQGDCVEMEGAAIAHVAAKNGIDCLVLRAISDNCDESYDALSSREFDLEEYAKSASSLVLSIVRRLAVQLGIEPRETQGDCVEMEGAAIAHVAAKNGIDCLVLRAISDNCDESYDALSSREFALEEYAKSASSLVLSIGRRLAVQLGIEPRD